MPPGQALGIALVIVLAVIGGLYLVWRSHTTGSYLRIVIGASRDSENDVQFLLWRKPCRGLRVRHRMPDLWRRVGRAGSCLVRVVEPVQFLGLHARETGDSGSPATSLGHHDLDEFAIQSGPFRNTKSSMTSITGPGICPAAAAVSIASWPAWNSESEISVSPESVRD